ncbi:unnamed protein product [Brassica rapa subsp. narinosa]
MVMMMSTRSASDHKTRKKTTTMEVLFTTAQSHQP